MLSLMNIKGQYPPKWYMIERCCCFLCGQSSTNLFLNVKVAVYINLVLALHVRGGLHDTTFAKGLNEMRKETTAMCLPLCCYLLVWFG